MAFMFENLEVYKKADEFTDRSLTLIELLDAGNRSGWREALREGLQWLLDMKPVNILAVDCRR